MDDQLKIENVRLSFPDIFKPKAVNPGDEPKYSAAFLIEKSDEKTIAEIKKAIWLVAKEKWGDKAKEMLQAKKGKDRVTICLHEGSDKEYDGYTDDNMYLSTSSKRRPGVVDRSLEPLTEDDGKPYAGCYVNAAVRFWAQDNNFGKKINCELLGIQFAKDGEPFGAAPFNPTEAFDKLDDKAKGKEKAAGGSDDDEIPI